MSALGGLFQATGTITSGILSYKLGKKQYELADKQFKEQQEMNKWEKEKYNNTLNNQTSAISTLGKAFGAVADTAKTQSAPATQTAPAQANTQAQTQAQIQPKAQTAPAQENKELPTQRM